MLARKETRPLSTRLAELRDAVVAAKAKVREADLAHRRAVGDVERLRDAAVDAYSDGDEARAARASGERAAAEAGPLREAEERHDGAKRAVAKAEAALGLFARQNLDGLLAERRPDAVAAASDTEKTVEQLAVVRARWNAIYGEISALLRLAGADTGTMPSFPSDLEALVRQSTRLSVSVPPPLPGEQRVVA